jgi:uncharacterized protein (TIGR02217 family)
MSQDLFPALPGLTFNSTKSPIWKSFVQTAASGVEVRGAYMSQPLWKWDLTFEFLREANALAEFQTLAAFFNKRQGMFDSFLYQDPPDHVIPDVAPYQIIGVGDGVNKVFQLTRALTGGGFSSIDNIYNVDGTQKVYVNNVLKTGGGTDYTLLNGVVTFVTAPAGALNVAWSGGYYWRVRFDMDQADFGYFAQNFWEAKRVTFQSVKGS